jgi:thioredoxin-like negative regulator of GroEL
MNRAGRLTILKLDTDANPEVAGRYGVSGILCLILFKGGKDPASRQC